MLNMVGKSPLRGLQGISLLQQTLSLISIYLHVHEILSTNQAPTQQPWVLRSIQDILLSNNNKWFWLFAHLVGPGSIFLALKFCSFNNIYSLRPKIQVILEFLEQMNKK